VTNECMMKIIAGNCVALSCLTNHQNSNEKTGTTFHVKDPIPPPQLDGIRLTSFEKSAIGAPSGRVYAHYRRVVELFPDSEA
jgi:hypothetical protein